MEFGPPVSGCDGRFEERGVQERIPLGIATFQEVLQPHNRPSLQSKELLQTVCHHGHAWRCSLAAHSRIRGQTSVTY
jgi:hypothetical protein